MVCRSQLIAVVIVLIVISISAGAFEIEETESITSAEDLVQAASIQDGDALFRDGGNRIGAAPETAATKTKRQGAPHVDIQACFDTYTECTRKENQPENAAMNLTAKCFWVVR